jgi:hypothetical protein
MDRGGVRNRSCHFFDSTSAASLGDEPMRYLALFVLGSFLISGDAAHACELGDKACADQKFLALGGDQREIDEDDLVNKRFMQATHCPPWDAMHPGRCDGMQDGPDIWRAVLQASQREVAELRAAHLHACQLGYALRGTCD